MVHRSTDSRLLANLISHEKDYSKHLQTLLDTSHASFNSLTAYASASPPPASQIILAVASSLYNADEALRMYAIAVEQWRQCLVDLKDLEDDIGNIIRDREILVTRLLKASKSSKPSSNRDSVSMPPPLSQAYQSSSTLSLKSSEDHPSTTYGSSPSFFSGATNVNKKLQSAQAELQACEAHLALKEKELEVKRTTAVREGLRVRFRALADCGWRWTQVGKEVQVFLGDDQDAIRSMSSSPLPAFSRPTSQVINSPDNANKPLPLPEIHTPVPIRAVVASPQLQGTDRSSELSSIAPSQSASQVNAPVASPPPSSPHIYTNLEVHSLPSTATTQSFNLNVPPAHAIEETTMPTSTPREAPPQRAMSPSGSASGSTGPSSYAAKRHVLTHRITEEDLGVSDGTLGNTNSGSTTILASNNKSQPPVPVDDGGSSDDEPSGLPANIKVVENPRFHRSGSTSVLGVPPSPKKEKNGLFGSIRGLFTRHGKDASTGSISGGGEDDESTGSAEPRGRRQRKPLFGRKNNRWDTRTDGNVKRLASANHSDEDIARSPLKAAFPRHESLDIPDRNPLGSSPSRTRVMSDVGTVTPTATRRLRKKSVKGKAVDDQEVMDRTGMDTIKQRRRRSASFDADILQYGNARAKEGEEDNNIVDLDIREERLSRAEEWVGRQKQHLQDQQVDEVKPQAESGSSVPGPSTQPQTSGETKKGTVRRKKSTKKSVSKTQSPSRPESPSSPTINDVYLVSVADGGATLSRNSSLSAASAPPAPGSRARKSPLTPSSASVSALPTHAPTTSAKKHQKAGSVDDSVVLKGQINVTGTTATTTKAQRRASSPHVFPQNSLTVGEGSTSLMSIVEDVAKANREAWNSSGGVKKSIGGTVKPVGLLDLETVKAPKSVTAKELEAMNLDAEAGKPKPKHPQANGRSSLHLALEIPKAPASLFDKHHEPMPEPSHPPKSIPPSSPAPVQPTPISPTTAPVIPQPRRPAQSPLKSALKNPSRTPSPMPPLPPPVEEKPMVKLPWNDRQTPSPPLHSSAIPNGNAQRPIDRVTSPVPQEPDSDESGSDAASISSYETGHEVLWRDEPASVTRTDTPPPPPPEKYDNPLSSSHAGPSGLRSSPNGLVSSERQGPSSDLSASTASTIVNQNLAQAQAQAQSQSGTSTPDSGPQPRRRKSVRVSLQPTFSPTPPAIEDDEPPSWETSWDSTADGKTGANDSRDIWDDSSSEDIEYSRARSLLSKLSRKDKKG
ncbi:hypothetical protein VNI00_006141 [Paramarasmius palmivorus]|uniref:Uncharacterized protein n=1 Tax=Paramarasmius palmivorus TaxID=297713 RepID=A0AAW0D5J8_9AGAR